MIQAFLSKYISRVKGNSYKIDAGIPSSYLIRLIIIRVMMKVRGRLRFPFRKTYPFMGRGARIISKKSISFGKNVTLGKNSHIEALSQNGIILGDNTSLGYDSRIECTSDIRTLGKGMHVGNNVGLGTNTYYGCAGGIQIGDDTIIGNFVSFHAENHNFALHDIPIRLQGVNHQGIKIGENCWIGAKVTILDGAVIESGCIIAAGALVKAGIYKSNGIYGGVPAKLIKDRFT